LFTATATPGSFDDADIDVVSLKTGEHKTILRGGFFPRYVATSTKTGYLIYLHQSTLFAVPFNAASLSSAGSPSPILEDVSNDGTTGGNVIVSTGTSTDILAYVSGGRTSNRIISLLRRSGKPEPLHAGSGLFFVPRFSPDGKRLAFSMIGGQNEDLWIQDLQRDVPSRLTFLSGVNRMPVWTPDGRNIVFLSTNPGAPGLYWIRSDGSGEPQRLTAGNWSEEPSSISPTANFWPSRRPVAAVVPISLQSLSKATPVDQSSESQRCFLGQNLTSDTPLSLPMGIGWLTNLTNLGFQKYT
jgi:hypothetical protein